VLLEDQHAEEFQLTLRPWPDAVPTMHRMKALLKIAGRNLALTCTSIVRVEPADAAAAAGSAAVAGGDVVCEPIFGAHGSERTAALTTAAAGNSSRSVPLTVTVPFR
jgi:hypothetical protein